MRKWVSELPGRTLSLIFTLFACAGIGLFGYGLWTILNDAGLIPLEVVEFMSTHWRTWVYMAVFANLYIAYFANPFYEDK